MKEKEEETLGGSRDGFSVLEVVSFYGDPFLQREKNKYILISQIYDLVNCDLVSLKY